MPTDEFQGDLKKELEGVEAYCSKEGIGLFPVWFIPEPKLICQWNDSVENRNEWQAFLSLLKTTGEKILIVEHNINSLDDEMEANSEKYLEMLEKEEREEYSEALETALKTIGFVCSYTLIFFYHGVCYQYSHNASWYSDYDNVISAVFEEAEKEHSSQKTKALSDEEVEGLAREITAEASYQAARTRTERNFLSRQLLRKHNHISNPDHFRVMNWAEELFYDEVLPKLEESIGKQIRELRDQGMKKVQVKSKLNITDAVLNGHWY